MMLQPNANRWHECTRVHPASGGAGKTETERLLHYRGLAAQFRQWAADETKPPRGAARHGVVIRTAVTRHDVVEATRRDVLSQPSRDLLFLTKSSHSMKQQEKQPCSRCTEMRQAPFGSTACNAFAIG
jgi:hypothetical protein